MNEPMKSAEGVRLSASNYKQIPKNLWGERKFIFWKLVSESVRAKPSKKPINPNTLGFGGQNDPSCYISLTEAIDRLAIEETKPNPAYHGIGIAFNNTDLVGIDLDDVYDDYGKLKPLAADVLSNTKGMVEHSVSGTGYHLLTRTDDLSLVNFKDHELGFEIFRNNYYIALTGDIDPTFSLDEFPLKPVDVSVVKKYHKRSTDDYQANRRPQDEFGQMRDLNLCCEELRDIVLSIQPPDEGYKIWLNIGMSCHHQTQGSDEGLDIWKEYSKQDPEVFGEYGGDSELESKWRSFNRGKSSSSITAATLRYYAKKYPKSVIGDLNNESAPLNYESVKAVRFVLQDFIAEGLTSFAGSKGIGKTSTMVELMSVITHLCEEDHFLRTRGRRHVVYFSEDTDQMQRSMFARKKFKPELKLTSKEIQNWFEVFQTRRHTKDELKKLIVDLGKSRINHVLGKKGVVEVPPLFVFDTSSASFDLSDENNNSEQGKMISAIKEASREHNASVWIIGHVSKGSAQTDLRNQSSRGAGSIEADVQTAVTMGRDLSKGPNTPTVLSIIKNRISTAFDELNFQGELKEELVEDDFGDLQTLRLLVGGVSKSTSAERMRQKDAAKATAKAEEAELNKQKLCSRIIEAVKQSELITTRALMKLSIGGKGEYFDAAINHLFAEGYLNQRNLTPDEKTKTLNPDARKGLFLTEKMFADFDI